MCLAAHLLLVSLVSAIPGFVHNGVLTAIVAHGLIGFSLLWDKVLLRRPATRNLVSYVFYMGAISIFGLLLIPFGYHHLAPSLAGMAFGAGALQMLAVYFYYAALKLGEASQTVAIMGGFSPLATVLIAVPLLERPLGHHMLPGFALLTLGGFVMFFSEPVSLRPMILPVLAASGVFGLVNVMEKLVYQRTNFVSGYVWSTLGTFIAAMFLLIRASWRRQIFESTEESTPRSRTGYFVNRFMAGVGSFLVYYAISRANPAVVDSIAGVRYALVFVGAFVLTTSRPRWLKEDFSRRALVLKTIGTALVVAGLVLVGLSGGDTSAT